MSAGIPINSARRTKTYLAATLVDTDGIKTSIASVAALTTYVPADFNGAVVATGGVLDLPRTVTIKRTAAANAYSTNPIVVTGKRGGDDVTESIAQPNDDGGETLRGTQLFDTITSIAIPANATTGGAFEIGVGDIGAPSGRTFTCVKLHANGNLNVMYGEYAGAPTDVIPCLADAKEPVAPSRILTDPGLASPTTVGLTVYLG